MILNYSLLQQTVELGKKLDVRKKLKMQFDLKCIFIKKATISGCFLLPIYYY